VNIYNTSDALTGNRTLTGAGFDLTFTGLDDFTLSVGTSINFTATNDIDLSPGDDLMINGVSGVSGEFIGNVNGHAAWLTPSGFSLTFGDSTQIPIVDNTENDFRYSPNFTFTKYGSDYGLFSVGSTATTRYMRFAAEPTSNGLQILDTGVGNVSIDHNSILANTAYTISTSSGDILVQSADDLSLTASGTGDGLLSGDDVTIDATVTALVLNGQTTWELTTGAAGSGDVTSGTGGMDIHTSGSMFIEVTTGTADMTFTVNAGAGRYLFVAGLPTTCSGTPTGAIAAVAGVLTVCP